MRNEPRLRASARNTQDTVWTWVNCNLVEPTLLGTIQVNPDSLITPVVRTIAIQIQPQFNPGSNASGDKPLGCDIT